MCVRIIVPLLEERSNVPTTGFILREAEQKGYVLFCAQEEESSFPPLNKPLGGFLMPFIDAGLGSSGQRIRTVTKSFISSSHSSLICHFLKLDDIRTMEKSK